MVVETASIPSADGVVVFQHGHHDGGDGDAEQNHGKDDVLYDLTAGNPLLDGDSGQHCSGQPLGTMPDMNTLSSTGNSVRSL